MASVVTKVGAIVPTVGSVNSPPTRPVVWLAFWLAVVFVITKGVHLGVPSELSADAVIEYVRDLAIVAQEDVLYALAIGLVGRFALRSSGARTNLERGVWIAWVLLCVASVMYAIASVQVFAYLRTPLTYSLLPLAGDIKNMRPAVGSFVTLPILLALVVGPAAYLVVGWGSTQVFRPKRSWAHRTAQAIGLIAISFYATSTWHLMAGPWVGRNDRRIADNPHWSFLSSCFSSLLAHRDAVIDRNFPPDDLLDFRTFAERPTTATHTAHPMARPQNVIVYVLESVGTQHMSVYGSPYKSTPCLQAEADNCLVFDNFYAHVGMTANSLVALTLSIYPGMTWREWSLEWPNMPGTSLAQVLFPLGYRTAFMTTGDHDYVRMGSFLRNRGFEEVRDYRQLDCASELVTRSGGNDSCLVDNLIEWIDEKRGQPFFAMAWTEQTHWLYELSPGQEVVDFFEDELPPDSAELGLFLNALLEADRQLGRLFSALRERGLDEDTLVVITGDHGDDFASPHHTYGHPAKLYQEDLNVPLILWIPHLRRTQPPSEMNGGRSNLHASTFDLAVIERVLQRFDTIGGHVDLNPTVLDLLGLAAPGSWQGKSLFDPSREPRAYFYMPIGDYLLGVRERDWKYVYCATGGQEELFHLASDPQEQVNVAKQHPEICRRLGQRLAAWMSYEQLHLAKLYRSSTP